MANGNGNGGGYQIDEKTGKVHRSDRERNPYQLLHGAPGTGDRATYEYMESLKRKGETGHKITPGYSTRESGVNKYGGKDSWDDYDNTNTMKPR